MPEGALPAGTDWDAVRRRCAGQSLARVLAFCGWDAAGIARDGGEDSLLISTEEGRRRLETGPVRLLWRGEPLAEHLPDWPREVSADAARFFLTAGPLGSAVALDLDLAVRRDWENPYYRVLYIEKRLHTLLSRREPECPVPALLPPQGRELALMIGRFPAAVRRAARELDPFPVNRYAVALSDAAWRFLRACPMEGEHLLLAADSTLRTALGLLGTVGGFAPKPPPGALPLDPAGALPLDPAGAPPLDPARFFVKKRGKKLYTPDQAPWAQVTTPPGRKKSPFETGQPQGPGDRPGQQNGNERRITMTIIDRSTWPREERYRFFATMSNPTYALTFPVDVTGLRRYVKEKHLSFYTALVFLVTKAMEDVEAFRLRDRNGTIVLHDRLVPSFTDLKPGSDLFHIVTLEAGEDLEEFCRRAKEQSAAQEFFVNDGAWGDELIYFTCLPWFPISGALNERNADPCDGIPRVVWGKWEERDGRTALSLSLELNHRLADGVHVGKFYAALNSRLARFEVR